MASQRPTASAPAPRPRGDERAPPVGGLVERDVEQRALATALSTAARGVGRLVVVEGDAGLGKTQLLCAARAQARRAGHPAALVHAADPGVPLATARRLVDALLVQAGADRADGAPPPGGVPLAERDGPGLLRAVARLARQGPLLVAIDDAHVCDPASLGVIDTLAHGIGSAPVVVVLARRPAAGSPAQHALDELGRLADVTTLRLVGLSPHGAAALTRAVLGREAPQLAAAAQRATGGNPLLLDALLRAARDDAREPAALVPALAELLPATVRRWAQRRLALLDASERTLLETVAVLGDAAALDDVAEVSGRSQTAVRASAAALARRGLLRTTDPVALDPPLLRWVLLDELADPGRRAVHAAAARVLIADGRVLDAAPHLLELPLTDDGPTRDRLRDGARAATARGDVALAVRLLRRALQDEPAGERRAALTLELGAALVLVRPRAADAVLREAMAHADEAALLLAEAHRFAGRDGDADALLIALARTAGAAGRDAAAGLWRPLWERSAGRPVPRDADPLPQGPPRDRTDRVLVVARALEALGRGAPADDVANALEPALAGGVLAHEPLGLNLPLVHALPVLAACGRPDEALAYADAALAEPRLAGAGVLTAAVRAARAAVLLHRDRLAEARADADAALPVLREHAPALVGTALEPAVRVRLAQGHDAEALALVASVPARDLPGDLGGLAALARARTAVAAGRPRSGVEGLLEAHALLAAPAANESLTPVLADAIDVLVALKEDHRALGLSRTLLAAQRRFGEPRGLGLALRAAAAVAGSRTERRQLLEQAAEALLQAGAQVERAEVLTRLALVLEQDHRAAEAQSALADAAELAAERGAARVHGVAAARLAALDGHRVLLGHPVADSNPFTSQDPHGRPSWPPAHRPGGTTLLGNPETP